ncbi:hypothetical protein WN943_007769 [Citrus x changshan-huyou]
MMRNGERLLKELIASSNGKYNPYRIFSAEELRIATNNYDEQNIVLEDPFRKLYKGFWQKRSISLMKYNGNRNQHALEWCINHIVYASRMSHKHIIKLIGCCLETQIPIPVFESVQIGTLADRIHHHCEQHFEALSLTDRLKVAMDIAHAVAYLHVGFSRPIVYRDMKPTNILFNEQSDAKLFDFSLSLSIPDGETHIELDYVEGTPGFIAPENFTTLINEQCDVYGFGAFLFELLTAQEVSDHVSFESRFHYEENVKRLSGQNCRFKEMVDSIIIEDKSCTCTGKEQQLQAFKQLTLQCMDFSPEDRPTMVDVAKQLRQMYRSCM